MYGKPKKSDFNWQIWQRLFLFTCLGLLVYTHIDAARCTFDRADERQLGQIVEDTPTRRGSSESTQAVGEARGFVGGFGHDAQVCFREEGFSKAPDWARYGTGASALLFVVFWLGRRNQLRSSGSRYSR